MIRTENLIDVNDLFLHLLWTEVLEGVVSHVGSQFQRSGRKDAEALQGLGQLVQQFPRGGLCFDLCVRWCCSIPRNLA